MAYLIQTLDVQLVPCRNALQGMRCRQHSVQEPSVHNA